MRAYTKIAVFAENIATFETISLERSVGDKIGQIEKKKTNRTQMFLRTITSESVCLSLSLSVSLFRAQFPTLTSTSTKKIKMDSIQSHRFTSGAPNQTHYNQTHQLYYYY